MDVYGGLKLKTSQIKENMNVFFHIHYFFLSVVLLNMKQILGWTPPPVSLMFAVSGGFSSFPSTLVAGVRALCDELAASSGWTLLLMEAWISNIYPYMIYDMPTYLSKRIVVHSKQISLERNRSENSKTLYIKNK